ncbi:alpha-glucosidase/alpha-galactosidase [Gynuella sunshinyii]|uniref:Alpha-galactosidase/6-phospho-beta-glucosidase, family 4 of glycosyl hydrolase n=1 Tax=Gynuella sunshinyii YC6258 TaxID=1445510 RepID=A0A0C5V7V8_9GAMM|nr:alpha-glucosidase/alpha-galactosidase [Gynuella sunshinyii]AJQ95505.1 alpha-galactosidase/6-phospho-beta-glucosidase, family 4 of glycosyl hydrolase [Gynuella sunshinyii YC6258]
MYSPVKIVLIGAGSTVFTRNLLGDIWSLPALADSHVVLHDIDQHRLDLSLAVANRLAQTLNVHPIIEAQSNRQRAIEGADFVINTIQVGGYRPATVADFEIPKKYGLRQTIADTLGIGGIMRGLRTIPVMLDMLKDMESLGGDRLTHLNYVNPMAMITWALNAESTRVPTIGLCHSVQYTAKELAKDLDIPYEEIDYQCAGINHMAFYTRFEHQGQDLYPKLRALQASGQIPDWNRVRYSVMENFGYFVTESSEHFAEYVPWFIKPERQDLLQEYNIPLDEYPGRCQVYETAWPFIERELQQPGSQSPAQLEAALRNKNIHVMEREIKNAAHMLTGLSKVQRSVEYGSVIINSIVTGESSVIYGNVLNDRLIDNLPQGCAVEVPCLVNRNGVQPTKVNNLPPQLAALMRTNIGVQELVVEAVRQRSRDHIYHAAMLDPHTASVLDVKQIRALVDELMEAHKDLMPDYFY